MTRKKESAAGSDTTTADTNNAAKIISLCTRIRAALIRYGAMLVNVFRGLA
jgi:hypothetical protein